MKDKRLLIFVGIGFELVGFILAGVWIGQILDQLYQLQGLATAGCIFLGLIIWIIHLVLLTRQLQKVPGNNGSADA